MRQEQMDNRLLSKLTLFGKTRNFCTDLSANFEGISEDMAEKLDAKDGKNCRFNKQKKFRKESNMRIAFDKC